MSGEDGASAYDAGCRVLFNTYPLPLAKSAGLGGTLGTLKGVNDRKGSISSRKAASLLWV